MLDVGWTFPCGKTRQFQPKLILMLLLRDAKICRFQTPAHSGYKRWWDDMCWHRVLTFNARKTLIGLMGAIKGQHFTFYNSQDEASL